MSLVLIATDNGEQVVDGVRCRAATRWGELGKSNQFLANCDVK